jgi:hypothetical protein
MVGYDGAIMTSRTQITLDPELQWRALRRASDLGISFAEYVRRLVEQDISEPKAVVGIEALFDLGSSGGSNIAKNKDAMIAEAFDAEAAASLHVQPLMPYKAGVSHRDSPRPGFALNPPRQPR